MDYKPVGGSSEVEGMEVSIFRGAAEHWLSCFASSGLSGLVLLVVLVRKDHRSSAGFFCLGCWRRPSRAVLIGCLIPLFPTMSRGSVEAAQRGASKLKDVAIKIRQGTDETLRMVPVRDRSDRCVFMEDLQPGFWLVSLNMFRRCYTAVVVDRLAA